MLFAVMRQRVNVTTASIPGPTVPLYLCGARRARGVPGAAAHRQRTARAWARCPTREQFNIGVVADRDAYPDLDVFVAGAREELEALGVSPHATADAEGGAGMTTIAVRDVRLFVDVVGHGYPLRADARRARGQITGPCCRFRQLSDRFTLVFYDHRCNGRSVGVPVSSMTWENLTADADALRERLGFDKWAVLGHSFGGKVALEYALRYPDSLSHLILLDTGGDSWWDQENAPRAAGQARVLPQEGRARAALVQRADRALGVLPDADATRRRLRSPHKLVLGRTHDVRRTSLQGAAAGARSSASAS